MNVTQHFQGRDVQVMPGLGLNAGCEVWDSVCGGLFPETASDIADIARVITTLDLK